MNPAPDYGADSYVGHGRLDSKTAIITGGDSGIGRAVALAFAREGADVVCSFLSEDKDAQKTAALIEAEGRKSVLIKGDLERRSTSEEIISQTISTFGKIDILVNNAAWQTPYTDLSELTDADLIKTFAVNVFAMFYLCRAAIAHMKPGSSIINTSSIQSADPSATLLPYATSKGAIDTFTKGLSEECIKKGIRVNAVAPGPVWTPLIASSVFEDKMKNFGKSNPTGRPAQPRELAPVYVLLASDEGSYINGEIIGVTGGRFMN
jgi:NAD(P)-dependent dehydrogenase (short-subunit alcohol dehydrogenase family)